MTKEALKLALEALEDIGDEWGFTSQRTVPKRKEALIAIKEALAQPEPWEKFCDSNCVWTDHHPDCKLAQPEQEPVAWLTKTGSVWKTKADETDTPLYTTPPQRKPLSDEEALELWNKHEKHWRFENNALAFARAIEAAHGIKGEA